MATPPLPDFFRDRFTWLAYVMLGYFAYLQAALGPAMPLLRDDLGLSYTTGGMHFSAMAFGLVVAGLVTDRAVARWGRRAVFWGGGAGMASGGLIVVAGRHPAITIFGAWWLGFLGTMLLATIQSSLADHHGPRRAIALTESNVVASASAALPPLLIGGLERLGAGWRGAFILPALVWAAAFAGNRSLAVPAPRSQPDRAATDPAPERALSPVFWLYWVALVCAVAAEWSVAAWGADYLVDVGELRKADASLLMTLFFLAMTVGRAAGSGLTRRIAVERLLMAVLATGLAGFMLFWLGPAPVVIVAGLFLVGLGMGNVFPFLLSITVSTAPDHADIASARVTLGAGLAILLAPQALGWAADRTGIQAAYGLVFGLFWLAAGATTFANRRATRHNRAGE